MRVLQTDLHLKILFILRPEEVCRISQCVCVWLIPPARTSLKLSLGRWVGGGELKGEWASFHKYSNKPATKKRPHQEKHTASVAPKVCADAADSLSANQHRVTRKHMPAQRQTQHTGQPPHKQTQTAEQEPESQAERSIDPDFI